MLAYRCDRCGSFIEDRGEDAYIIREQKNDVTLDLCPKCYRQLETWLKRERKKKPSIIETPEFNGGFIFN